MPGADESLAFQGEGDDFRLVRIDAKGQRSEIVLAESNVVALMKLIQQTLPTILAKRLTETMVQQGVEPLIAVRVSRVLLNTDLHRSEILLKIFDEYGNETGFAFPLEIAEALASTLPRHLARLKPPTKQ